MSNVRLTDDAHTLLVEKAKNLGDSMKEVASEAVISLFSRELKYNAYIARINRLEKEVDNSKWYAGGLFILGAVVSGCVMLLVEVLW